MAQDAFTAESIEVVAVNGVAPLRIGLEPAVFRRRDGSVWTFEGRERVPVNDLKTCLDRGFFLALERPVTRWLRADEAPLTVAYAEAAFFAPSVAEQIVVGPVDGVGCAVPAQRGQARRLGWVAGPAGADDFLSRVVREAQDDLYERLVEWVEAGRVAPCPRDLEELGDAVLAAASMREDAAAAEGAIAVNAWMVARGRSAHHLSEWLEGVCGVAGLADAGLTTWEQRIESVHLALKVRAQDQRNRRESEMEQLVKSMISTRGEGSLALEQPERPFYQDIRAVREPGHRRNEQLARYWRVLLGLRTTDTAAGGSCSRLWEPSLAELTNSIDAPALLYVQADDDNPDDEREAEKAAEVEQTD